MNTTHRPPEIRPASPGDARSIARLVCEALGDKYRPALGGRAMEGIAALVDRDVGGAGANQRWVAEVGGRMAGCVALVLDHDPDAGFPGTLARAVGWPRAIRATLVLGTLGHGRLTADEGYIDELAVAGWARRRGVARALIETCAAQARAADRSRLTLSVTIDNDAARRLYATSGFCEIHRRRWLTGRLLFRAPGAILMERRLAPGPQPCRDPAVDRGAAPPR